MNALYNINKITSIYNQTITTLYYLYKCIFINYKSWIILILAIILISLNDLNNGLKTFFFILITSHLFHYACHIGKYTNSVHLYHHNHNNYLSHFSQMILEFFSILFFIFSKHTFGWSFLNESVIFFFYLFYTTVHNVNYSIFHVNNVHENHHKLQLLNLGPDICDILFQTKFDLPNSIENTDHYILNIFFVLIIIFIGKIIWTNSTPLEKNLFTNIFVSIYGVLTFILLVLTIYFNFVD